MAEFTLEIAGYTVQVQSLFDSTRDYCRNYLTEEAPAFAIRITREDLEAEQTALNAEAVREGIRLRRFTDFFLERAAVQRKLGDFLLPRGVLLLHGSALAVDGKGYLFTADCGTGKSTHARLWRQVFGNRAVMINDDRPFLQLLPEGVQLCGSPWSGKHGLDANMTVPLKGICILTRGKENHIRSITPEEALPMLEKQSGLFQPAGPGPEQLALVKVLSKRVRLWHMQCNMAPEAAKIAYAAMSAADSEPGEIS